MSVPDGAESDCVTTARDRLDREAEAVRTEQLSERLVESLLAGPRAGLREPSTRTDAARTILDLFDQRRG